MAKKWPQFVTKDLDSFPDSDAEMQRRWELYDREMKALIAAGGVHQDDDGWWIDDATGELIGPDPEIERPRTEEELAQFRPFAEVFPDQAESIRRSRGRPPLESPKKQVTLRIDADVLERLRASGKGWQGRVNEVLKKTVGL
ncbi:BrnA antitoxin family protein [Devosia sp. LjRoot3]|uniref:BrnA antitoxin family protein n=1 Tax=Devosia sp. LjRoot3 TaxID=3342319 RepID=UPI003ECFCFCA